MPDWLASVLQWLTPERVHAINNTLMIVGAAGGPAFYLLSRWYHKRPVEPLVVGECLVWGFMAGTGIDLLFCLAAPEELVQHRLATGALFPCPIGVNCAMTEMHVVHVAFAGVVTATAAIMVIVEECRRKTKKR